MANYVKISVIGPAYLTVDVEEEPQRIVERMLDYWRDNFQKVLPEEPDLIVVPEVCDRPVDCKNPDDFPFDKAKQYYQTRKDQVRDLFAKTAKENDCYIVYSADKEMPDGTRRNSSVMLDRKGDVAGIYNKNHLVVEEMTEEGKLYGKDIAIVDCDFGRVGFAICFDLNFDELRLKYVQAKPDLIIFSSMWHGGLMQAYWSYSCRCHFVGAIAGKPPCEIRNPFGKVMASSTNYFDFVTATVNLDCCLAHLDYNQDKLKAMKDKYGIKVKILDPGYMGSVLISSEDENLGVEQMVKEFQIELLDDYMKRALAHRHKPGNMEK